MKDKIIIVFIVINILLIKYGYSQYPSTPLNEVAMNYLPVSVDYPFTFVVIGDTRRNDENTGNNPIFIDMMENQIKNLVPKPAFVIDVGDFVYSGTYDQYSSYYTYIKNWMTDNNISFFSIPGNHEFYTEGSYTQFYPSFIGNKYYSFDYGNLRVVTLNNVQHCYGCSDYIISQEELIFADEKFSEQGAPPLKFGFTHIPFFISEDANIYNNESYFSYWDILCNNNVKANFDGHIHFYYRKYFCNNIFDITTGGGGAYIYGGPDEPPITHYKYHFLVVTITQDNNIQVKNYFLDTGNDEYAKKYDFYMPTNMDYQLQNITVQTNDNKTFVAQNSIEVAGNGTTFFVLSGGAATLEASNGILLDLGITAETNLTVQIQNLTCEDPSDKSFTTYINIGVDDEHFIKNKLNKK